MPIRPLLNRCPLELDESLPSLLARLQVANYYASPRAMADICRPHLPPGEDLHLPHLAETWPVLSEVTCLPPADLYHASLHHYAAALALPWENLSYVMLPGGECVSLVSPRIQRLFLRPVHDAQYCPVCLTNGRYHRRQWLNLLAAICPQHECLLQRGCPHCQQQLPVAAIFVGKCQACTGDLTATPTLSVSHDSWGLWAHRQLHSWWGDTPAPPLPDQMKMPEKSVPILLELLRGLETAAARLPQETLHPAPCLNVPSPAPKLRELPTPIQVYRVYATAMKVLTDWPQAFHDFLDTYRRRPSTLAGQIVDEFDPMYFAWLENEWQRPEFAFIQDAFDDYLVANYSLSRSVTHLYRYQRSQSFRDRFPYLTQMEAAERLGVELEIVQRLVDVQMLIDYERGEGQQRYGYQRLRIVRRKEFIDLQRHWQTGIPLVDVARLLAVEPQVVEKLVNTNLLKTRYQADTENNSLWRLDAISVNTFFQSLSRYPNLPLRFGKPVPLWELVAGGCDLIQVLQRILAGEVAAAWFWGGLYSMWVSHSDLHLLRS
jgi:hypothetical protein